MATTIVLIHGAFVDSTSWEQFVPFFQDLGYEVVAPEWPRKSAETRGGTEGLAGLGVAEIVAHYQSIVEALPDPPVLIGHSFGGLFVELLLNRGLGLAGVALDPAPPRGVLRIAFSEFKSVSPALLHPSTRKGVVTLTPEQFNYGFTNTFPPDAAAAAYERYAVPETGRIFFEGALANYEMHSPIEIDYAKPDRAPLLITAGEKDNTIPPSIARSAYEKYQKSPARTDFVEFPDVPHLLMVAPGWERVAKYVAGWLEESLPADAVPERIAVGTENSD
jgi:pimeloyl-ACP methyl ester carboxylesterase